MTLARLGAAILLAAVVAIGAFAVVRGGAEGANEKRFEGEEGDVAAVVDRLQEYARDGDGAGICSEVMTAQLARFIATSFDTSCAARVNEQLGAPGTTITVERLRVDGPLASATVSEQNRNVTGMAFVKRDGEWRISRIRG
jgi:hypothetical protein